MGNFSIAKVYLDDKFLGKTPLTANKILAISHPRTLKIMKQGYLLFTRNVTIPRENALNLGTIYLKNLTGKWQGILCEYYSPKIILKVEQSGTHLQIRYKEVHGNYWNTATLLGKITNQGKLKIKVKGKIRYHEQWGSHQTSRIITLIGTLSKDWNRIDGVRTSIGGGIAQAPAKWG